MKSLKQIILSRLSKAWVMSSGDPDVLKAMINTSWLWVMLKKLPTSEQEQNFMSLSTVSQESYGFSPKLPLLSLFSRIEQKLRTFGDVVHRCSAFGLQGLVKMIRKAIQLNVSSHPEMFQSIYLICPLSKIGPKSSWVSP